ncbi:hypothetical protein LTR49_023049 [Elasticomyces elasticus]|nr:hypothetical protein LTR49_023049 [Elasticomyces elasticus]
MSDGLNPSGPAQPGLDQVYEVQGNQASKEPAEQRTAQQNANDSSLKTELIARRSDQRIPSQHSNFEDATPSSMARGIRGAPPGEESKGLDHEDVGRNKELVADQLGTYGEDQIADSVKGTQAGAAGKEQDMASDLDRKKAEQAPAREKQQKEEEKSFDVGGILGQRGGPANPVDKKGYPNSSS